MNKVFLALLFLAVLYFAISGVIKTSGTTIKPNEPSVHQGDTSESPKFLTTAKTFKVMEGETVVLPCKAKNTGKYKQAWKRDIAILTAGNVKVTPDTRVKLIGDDYDLEISDVVVKDAGDYVCQVATLQPIEITHKLDVLVPPKILQITGGGIVDVRKGLKVLLECNASGNPPPLITWTRKNNLVLAGKKSVEGSTLVIEETNRHHAGVYICSADNEVGNTSTREVTLNILYVPEIEPEKNWVHAGIGMEAQLVCIVHAHPPADVKWYRSTLRLEPTERHRIEVRGSRHSLIFNSVQEDDFANYTCKADNAQGRTRQYVILSGNPHVAIFRSPSSSQSSDSYLIAWSVTSYAPVVEYKLTYRKVPQAADNFLESDMTSQRKATRKSAYGVKDWTEIVVAGDKNDKELTHEKDYLIRGLDSSTEYEARIQARNVFGWNQISEPFKFTTRGIDGITREPTIAPEAILPEAEVRDLGVKAKDSSCESAVSWLLFSLLLIYFI